MKIIIFVLFFIVNQVIGLSIKNENVTIKLLERKWISTVQSLERSWNSQLKDFLENDLRNIISDPYYQYKQFFKYSDKKLSFKGTFDEFYVYDLSQYIVKYSNVNFWTRKVDVKLYFPVISSEGYYDINLYYQNNPYIGKGVYKATIEGLHVQIEAWVSIWGGLHVTYLNTYLSLLSFNFSGTNKLLDNSNDKIIWNKSISELVPKILKDDHDAFTKYISDKLISLINNNLY